MPPTVIIATPMFNSAATIEQTLQTVRRQTFTDWRCVVVNDGSTDGCEAIVERLAREDERIELLNQPKQGLPEARNAGLERALAIGSEFIMLLDSDDLIAPQALQWLVPAAREAGASYGGFEFIDHRARPIGRQSPMSATTVGLDEQIEWYRTMLQVTLFSREAIGSTRFDPEVRLVEDWLWCTRLALKGVRWRGVEKIVAGYRLRPDGISRDFSRMNEFHQMGIRKIFAEARASEWASRVDLSDQRHALCAGSSAFGFATMQALCDSAAGMQRGIAIYEQSKHPERLTSAQIAQAASNAVPFGLCTSPDLDGVRERKWLPTLRQWWGACAERNWIRHDDIEPAFHELSRKIIHPDTIVDRMLNRARAAAPSGAIGVLGLDRGGRRLARRAINQGFSVMAFDTWSDELEIAHLDAAKGLTVVRDETTLRALIAQPPAFPSTWLTAMTGPQSNRAVEQLRALARPSSVNIAFWNDEREQLGQANEALIDAAFEPRHAKVG